MGASVLLIAGSAIALVFGWIAADQSLIWTSIAATTAAAVTLSLAYFRSRGAPATRERSSDDARREDAGRAEATSSSAGAMEDEVIAVPSTKKFHRADCRYASASNAERMSRAEARKLAFTACGVCKP